nr:immunoglobulin heavy chain junction region [Macaca mulatta]MOV48211.1 immunoglobulin heavy chain junction region [Macaca mulatta]MOV49476.1 immunoglobulin heavy chain junction region [Macaca mulatta]MOV53173.1 immunoglobulin heavy chain junction region [Macaca mulatta]
CALNGGYSYYGLDSW